MLARGSGPLIVFFFACFLISEILRILFGWIFLTISFVFLAFIILMLVFFRDPSRKIGNGIVAAADGIVQGISKKEKFIRIETFMNVHNVHVNRAPLDGKVRKIERRKGALKPAYAKDADKNQQVITILDTEIGEVRVVQIVGIFARRIVPYIKEEQVLSKGQRIGMIRFGSRVDVYLPVDRISVTVRAGQKVKAGETTLAKLKS